jgi:hypothetical protein
MPSLLQLVDLYTLLHATLDIQQKRSELTRYTRRGSPPPHTTRARLVQFAKVQTVTKDGRAVTSHIETVKVEHSHTSDILHFTAIEHMTTTRTHTHFCLLIFLFKKQGNRAAFAHVLVGYTV